MTKLFFIFYFLIPTFCLSQQKLTETQQGGLSLLHFSQPRNIAKNKCIDTSILEVCYLFSYTEADNVVLFDKRVLQIGKIVTKSFSYFANKEDSLWFKSKALGQKNYNRKIYKENEAAIWIEYFTYFDLKKIISTLRFYADDYQYEEEMPLLK